MIEKFLETIKKNKMFKKGDGIVVAVSGGPDSICLLHHLWRIRDEWELKLYVVHLNHQFRGKEAEIDADYVKEFCDELGIESLIYSENVAEFSEKRGMTFEEAGREIRYGLFDEVMEKKGATKVAVGQNMDDQAETVLMRLMRGTGIEGLSGIDYVRDKKIIRPLLDISRREIEDYCKRHDLRPRTDKTNLVPIYTRNRIRLEILPLMEEHFNQNVKLTLCRMANLLREDKAFINQYVEETYPKLIKKYEEEIRLNVEAFKREDTAIQKRILREAIRDLRGDIKNIQNQHIEKLIHLIYTGSVGGEMNLPKKMVGILDYTTFILRKKKTSIDKIDFEYNVNVGEKINIKELSAYMSCVMLDVENIKKISKDPYKKYFDLDKFKGKITLRNRRQGDRFTPFGMEGSKKLKDYFIDKKIPREIRDGIPLVCDGNEIVWIIGHRMSNKYKVDEGTKKILVLSYGEKGFLS